MDTKTPFPYSLLIFTTILMVIICALILGYFIYPRMQIENAAHKIKEDTTFIGKSDDYKQGFLDGIDYFRWYMNDRAINSTVGV
jgi:hypothetical protein